MLTFAWLLLSLFAAPWDDGPRDAGGEVLIVLAKGAAQADFVDVATGEIRRSLPTGAGPHEIAVSPDGALAVVTDYGQRTPGRARTVLDLERGDVARTVELGEYTRPHGIAFVGSRRVLVTSETTRSLVEVDVAQGHVRHVVTRSFRTGVEPDGLGWHAGRSR